MADLNIIQTIEKTNLMMKTGELELYKKINIIQKIKV